MPNKYLLQCQKYIREHKRPLFDFHMHTSWTDGAQSPEEMYDQAVFQGLRYILFSEHARQSSVSWFFNFAKTIRSLPKSPCIAMLGVESKILDFDGNLDITKSIVEMCDIVVASVHRFPGETGRIEGHGNINIKDVSEIEFQLSWAALENPDVDVLGHPFGMTYRRFQQIPDKNKIRALIKKASQSNKAFEINARYHPEPKQLIKMCLKEGTIISLSSDAHNVQDVGRICRILAGEEKPWNPYEF